jgi:hypothetical protein
MKTKLGFLVLLLPLAASAQSLGDHTTCYSWNGGNHSSGSFIQCDTWTVPQKKVAVAPLPPPVVASPIMMPMSAPVTCVPPPKPVVQKKRVWKKPPPKC